MHPSLSSAVRPLICSVGVSLTQPIFHSGALMAQRRAAIADCNAALAQYQQAVLNAFQNAADTLIALDQDALTLQAAINETAAASQSFSETGARYRLGAIPTRRPCSESSICRVRS